MYISRVFKQLTLYKFFTAALLYWDMIDEYLQFSGITVFTRIIGLVPLSE